MALRVERAQAIDESAEGHLIPRGRQRQGSIGIDKRHAWLSCHARSQLTHRRPWELILGTAIDLIAPSAIAARRHRTCWSVSGPRRDGWRLHIDPSPVHSSPWT